ncbi:hypothetical protein A2U01_0066160, partial [Trifolium medium]|nr:hypothetical protein [Trifolium medium]
PPDSPTTGIRAFGLIHGGSSALKFRLEKIDGRVDAIGVTQDVLGKKLYAVISIADELPEKVNMEVAP